MPPFFYFYFQRVPGLPAGVDLHELLTTIPWADRTETRRECFMSELDADGKGMSYTYGSGRGVRSYTSVDYVPAVRAAVAAVNEALAEFGWGDLNGCFANCYVDDTNHLGWHADNFDKMDHTRPVVSVSFGEPREIWWRPIGDAGATPPERRRLLEDGSMFVMLPGMQQTHEHRIPRGSRPMGPRVSLTMRRFLP